MPTASNRAVVLWPLALITGLWPLLVANLALVLSIAAGEVAPAFPYVDGAMSVSKAARQDPTLYWFRIAMMPYALWLAGFWWLNDRWLTHRGEAAPGLRRTIWILGTAAAAMLLVYVGFLGTDGVIYNWLRRFGASFYFAGTALAQLLAVRLLWRLSLHEHPLLRRWVLAVAALSLVLVVLAFSHAALPALVSGEFDIENVTEWHFGLFMSLWFMAYAPLWKHCRFALATREQP